MAGMFMLFRSELYRAVKGFNEAYFLYYEDADLCRRLHRAGKSVIYNPKAEIIHDARRASHTNPRLAFHHISSALRYFLQP
jgi:GT2 family glycosyltransferase